MPDLIKVKALQNDKIYVEYSNGVSGEVPLAHLRNKPGYASIFDGENFQSVVIDNFTKDLIWNSGVLLCKNALYKQLELILLMKKLRIDLNKI